MALGASPSSTAKPAVVRPIDGADWYTIGRGRYDVEFDNGSGQGRFAHADLIQLSPIPEPPPFEARDDGDKAMATAAAPAAAVPAAAASPQASRKRPRISRDQAKRLRGALKKLEELEGELEGELPEVEEALAMVRRAAVCGLGLQGFEEEPESDDEDMTLASDGPAGTQPEGSSPSPHDSAPAAPTSPGVSAAVVSAKAAEIAALIPAALRQQCTFDVEPFVTRVVEHALQDPHSKGPMPELIAGGATQSRKTGFKAVMAIIGHHLGIATVIVTKGVKERNSLALKIRGLLAGTAVLDKTRNIAQGHGSGKQELLEQTLTEHGCLVLSDTAAQMRKAKTLINSVRGRGYPGRFFLVVDEADEMYRTADQALKLEQAYALLSGDRQEHANAHFYPVLRLQVSATLVPVLLKMRERPGVAMVRNTFFTKPGPEYNALEQMQPLRGSDGRDVFLRPGELKNSNLFFNDKVDLLYKDAASRPRALLLDISNSRVRAAGNIYTKAEMVQALYPTVCVVAISGSGVEVRPPGEPGWEKKDPALTIGAVLAALDGDAAVGLATPIFVFGYTRMVRGDSFRSDRRVPTHILQALGSAMSVERTIQALGRATFFGMSTLEANGFEHATVLTTDRDWDTAQAYPRFQRELRRRMDAGDTPMQIFGPGSEFPWETDITYKSSRTVGNKRARLGFGGGAPHFAEAPAGARRGQAYADQQLEKDSVTKLVLQAVRGVQATIEQMPLSASASANGVANCTEDDLLEAIGDDEHGQSVISGAGPLRAALKELYDAGQLVRERPAGAQRGWMWGVRRR